MGRAIFMQRFWFCLSIYIYFAKIKAIMYFAEFLNVLVKLRSLNFSQNKLYIWNLQITGFKMIYDIFVFLRVLNFSNFQK